MDIPQFLMGIGSMVAGLSSLRSAFKKSGRRTNGLGRLQLTGEHKGVNGDASARIYRVNNIEERLAGVAKQIMVSVRDPRVRQLAVSIVSRRSRKPNEQNGDGGWAIPERDYWGEVKAIFNWMRANVRYIRDTSTIDTFATAMRTIEARGGDCDDYTIALGALLMSIGYSVRMKTIQTKDSDDWNHIYLQVGLPPGKPTKWRSLDASVAQPAGWEAPSSIIKKARVDAPEDPKWRRHF
jgi:hypothetical protein